MHHINENESPEKCMKTILDLQVDQHRTGARLVRISATSHPGMSSARA